MTVVEDTVFWQDGAVPVFWDEAARKCVYAIYASEFKILNDLAAIRAQLDYLISVGMGNSHFQLSADEFADNWRLIGIIARNAAHNSNIINYEYIRPGPVVDELTTVLIKKQTDYGHDNINRFGRIGLLVRLHDKVARIENLTKRGAGPENESLRDNYMDVINYCAIGMMVEMGWFLLDLYGNATVAEDIR